MIHITSNLKPFQYMSGRLRILPPVNGFEIFEVILAVCGFLIFAATPAEMIGLAIFNPSLVKLIYIFSLPFKNFFIIFSKPLLSI